ncbi:MAG: FAD-binding protein, partial [Deltaproteobacteria bacterium]|nr:FAD-binding protein [Deltaproteobacteria bacterium]
RRELIETDVLVAGGGLAGCWAALQAREGGCRVTLVSKGVVGRSGSSVVAAGTWTDYQPDDDLGGYLRDLLSTSDSLDDYRMGQFIYEQSYRCRLAMEGFGVPWLREDGRLVRRPGLGMTVAQNALFKGGLELMLPMRAEVLRRGITVLDKVMLTDLLTADGCHPTRAEVIGAVGFHVQEGTFYVLRAKAVVLATGDWGLKSGYHPSDNTGEGQAAAFRAGATLRNMDQLGYSIVAREGHVSALHAIFGHGGVLRNRVGRRFMEAYDPVLLERTSRSKLTYAAARESRDGEISLDCTHFDEPTLNRLRKVIPRFFGVVEANGYDLGKDRIPFTLALYGNGPAGGIRIAPDCSTGVAGLYVAGATSDRAGYIGMNGLNGAAALGYQAGASAAAFARERPLAEPDHRQTEQLLGGLIRRLGTRTEATPLSVFQEAKRIIHEQIGRIKHEQRLREAIAALGRLEREVLPGICVQTPQDLRHLVELEAVVRLGILCAEASSQRTESRYFNFREDYPDRDDARWLRWITVSLGDQGEAVWGTEEIPRYAG